MLTNFRIYLNLLIELKLNRISYEIKITQDRRYKIEELIDLDFITFDIFCKLLVTEELNLDYLINSYNDFIAFKESLLLLNLNELFNFIKMIKNEQEPCRSDVVFEVIYHLKLKIKLQAQFFKDKKLIHNIIEQKCCMLNKDYLYILEDSNISEKFIIVHIIVCYTDIEKKMFDFLNKNNCIFIDVKPIFYFKKDFLLNFIVCFKNQKEILNYSVTLFKSVKINKK